MSKTAKPSCPCSLFSSATNPRIPTRHIPNPDAPDDAPVLPYPYLEPRSEDCLLFVGEAPGYHEDQQGVCWVGFSGTLLQRFIHAAGFHSHCDVYVSNACRCRPDFNQTPPRSCITACRPLLAEDICHLANSYSRIFLFALGQSAAVSLCGLTRLSSGFRHQGAPLTYYTQRSSILHLLSPDVSSRCWCYFSYHPAILSPGRKPALVSAVQDHFVLCRRHIAGQHATLPSSYDTVISSLPDDAFFAAPVIALDIETYGILAGKQQTVFHPVRSRQVDGVPFSEQVVSCAFAVRTDSSYRAYYYKFPQDRLLLRAVFRRLADRPTPPVLLGQNIKFDLQYLRAFDPICASYLTPLHFRLDDTLLHSFLLYEQRPERGLKELASLFGLTQYGTIPLGAVSSGNDPSLIHYNTLDAVTTYRLWEYCTQEIHRHYNAAAAAAKTSALCATMRSDILWCAVGLESAGFMLSRPQLSALHTSLKATLSDALSAASSAPIPLTLSGSGSDTSCRNFISDALRSADLLSHPDVEMSQKQGKVSITTQNINLLLTYLPADSPYRAGLEALRSYKDVSKLHDAYTSRLLANPSSHYYPLWYPIPLYSSKSASTVGGTIQGRFACKDPAAQTFPPSVKACLTSRFGAYGRIISYDLSQIELRVAALLSGDPLMLDEYNTGVDRHTATALTINPQLSASDADFPLYRQAGKTLNFLVLYLGGPAKFRDTLRQKLNIDWSYEECAIAIQRFDARYPVFRAWQRSLIASVRRDGYYCLPTGWSRTFATGSAADTYINEIANFPIQTTAAQLLQSAEAALYRDFLRLRLRSCIILQIHDALYIDLYTPEEHIVDSLCDRYLTHPPLLSDLESYYNRTVKLEYKKES